MRLTKTTTLNYAILSLLILISAEITGQVPGPPSLAIGTGKVLYEKGILDADIISTIIATKQDEIKNELASRLIMEKLNNESFVIQNFAAKNLELLFKERNIQVVKKELLKNSAELMITTATLEFYLRAHKKKDGSDPFTNVISDVIDAFNESSLPVATSTGLIRGVRDYAKIKALVKNTEINYKLPKTLVGYLLSGQNPIDVTNANEAAMSRIDIRLNESLAIGGNFLPKPTYIFDFKELVSIYVGSEQLYLQNILLDLTYGVLAKNQFFQQLGLFSSVRTDRNKKLRDSYLFFCSKADLSSSSIDLILYNKLKNFEKCLESDLNFLTKYQFVLSQIDLSMLQSETTQPPADEKINELLEAIKKSLTVQKLNETLCKQCDKTVFTDLLALVNSDLRINNSIDDSWLYSINTKVLPSLLQFNITNNSNHSDLIDKVESFQIALRQRLIYNLSEEWKNLPTKKQGSDILFPQNELKATMLRLISLTVNNFDMAETYEIVTNFISGLGALSTNPIVEKISSKIIDAGEKYIMVQKDSNKISFDVESMAVDLHKHFSENSNRKLSAYFSVGLNYNAPIGHPLEVDGNEIEAYSFLSEKIGLKYSIVDFGRKYTYFNLDRKPIVKDIHALAFGSGLLYQIKELSTAKNFSSPIVGAGLGISFFNGLDLNLNYAFPIEANIKNSLLNVSFDIKITEYLSELSKARKSKSKSK